MRGRARVQGGERGGLGILQVEGSTHGPMIMTTLSQTSCGSKEAEIHVAGRLKRGRSGGAKAAEEAVQEAIGLSHLQPAAAALLAGQLGTMHILALGDGRVVEHLATGS